MFDSNQKIRMETKDGNNVMDLLYSVQKRTTDIDLDEAISQLEFFLVPSKLKDKKR